jgi:hypothetical protein
MLRRAGTLVVAIALGAGSALGAAACGDEERGDVQFEGDTGGTATGGTSTAGTETAGTETSGTETAETETAATEPTTTPP